MRDCAEHVNAAWRAPDLDTEKKETGFLISDGRRERERDRERERTRKREIIKKESAQHTYTRAEAPQFE